MAGRLKQPSCNGRDCEDTCAAAIGTPSCASRTGSGNLRGWSKFQNFNSGDWNTRKATRAAFSASPDPNPFGSSYASNATNCALGVFFYTRLMYTTGAIALWNVAANAILQWAQYIREQINDLNCPSSTPTTNHAPHTTLDGGNWHHSGTRAQESVSDFSVTYGSDFPSIGCNPSDSCSGADVHANGGNPHHQTTTWVIDQFDTVDAALARGTPTNGTLCKTTTSGTIGSTTAGSATQIAITGATSVKVTIPLSGLTIGQDYEMDIVIKRYTAGGGAFVDEITDTVEFTAEDGAEDYEYDVPLNTDFDYEFDHAENLVEV